MQELPVFCPVSGVGDLAPLFSASHGRRGWTGEWSAASGLCVEEIRRKRYLDPPTGAFRKPLSQNNKQAKAPLEAASKGFSFCFEWPCSKHPVGNCFD